MANNYPGNYNYVRDDLGVDPITNPRRFVECINAMEKYATPWWFDDRLDCVTLANHQLREPVLLIKYSTFKKGVEKVLGRSLSREGELVIENTALIDEFDEKYKLYISNNT